MMSKLPLARHQARPLEDPVVAPMPMLVLLHSPLVGPLTWQPAATSLRAAGYEVAVPSLTGVLDTGPPFYRKLAETVAATIRRADPTGAVVLVGHSGAGALLPAAAEAAGVPVAAAVFVDAVLPHPGATWFETAPPALREQLRELTSDGRLLPWNQWFPPEAVNQLLPEEDLRRRFIAELPRLPLAYLEEPAPVVSGWPPARCGYLRLSGAYDEVADAAERQGWLVVREAADHLAMLTRPAAIAGLLDRLIKALVDAGRRRA
jgi:pimeloyl-ACP methyl ester carboxylesterase